MTDIFNSELNIATHALLDSPRHFVTHRPTQNTSYRPTNKYK